MGFRERWRTAARRLEQEVYALFLACRDPRTPVYARLLAACVVAYAFSPIDLIPDFIPVLGHVDDLVILPLGILIVRQLIPKGVMADCRARAQDVLREGKPVTWWGAVLVAVAWLILAGGGILVLRRWLRLRG